MFSLNRGVQNYEARNLEKQNAYRQLRGSTLSYQKLKLEKIKIGIHFGQLQLTFPTVFWTAATL